MYILYNLQIHTCKSQNLCYDEEKLTENKYENGYGIGYVNN